MSDEAPSIASYRDLTRQLLTLASAILAITLTFLTDVLGADSLGDQPFLVASWALYLLSILAGLATLMGVTGVLYCIENPNDTGCTRTKTVYSWSVRGPSLLQVVAFFLATAALVVAGISGLDRAGSDGTPTPTSVPPIATVTTVSSATT